MLKSHIIIYLSGMTYDLGFDFMDLEPDPSIRKFLRQLESEFSLVLITEYFDESLVMLKRIMCWQLDDILYIKQNQRLVKPRAVRGFLYDLPFYGFSKF